MSTATLSSLRDYLCGTLSPSNMLWLAEQLTAYAKQEELKPYTMEELNARIDEAERQIAAGLSQDSDEMFRELEKGQQLKPYTMEELNARIAKAERDFAEGRYFTDEEVFSAQAGQVK